MDLTINSEDRNPDRPIILYHCGHEQCKPSHSYGPAIRPHFLIHYIRHGQGIYYVDGKSYHLKGGEGFLIYPGVSTIYTADKHDPWEYCWIGFGGTDVENLLTYSGLSPDNHTFSDQSDGLLWEAFQKLILIYNEKRENEFALLSQLYLIFSHMYIASSANAKTYQDAHIEKALNYIHNNYTYDIKITDISNFLHIDRTYLYKLFITYVKSSPQQYLIQYRINESKKLLKKTNLSVTEIASSCGFRDASSFNKHFKKLVQIAPLQYRKQKQFHE